MISKPETLAHYTDHELLLLKARLLCDYEFLVRALTKWVDGRKFNVEPFHKMMFDVVEKILSGDPEYRRVIINVPPRSGKTDIFVKDLFTAIYLNNNKAKNLHASYSDRLALDNSKAVQDRLNCAEILYLFGPIVASKSKELWSTFQGGGMRAAAAGAAITGFGAGISGEREYSGTGSFADGFGGAIVIDDPLKPDDALSDVEREKVNSRFNSTFASRRNSDDVPIIVVMQRIHEDDLSGFLLNGGSGEKWKHIKVPVVVGDESQVLVSDDGWDTIYPPHYSKDFIRALKKSDPYTYAGQYMQEPAPLEGGIIKKSWFGLYDELPKISKIVVYADTAQKTKDHNDFSVFQAWGVDAKGDKIYLVDQIRGKWEAPELLKQAASFWTRVASRKEARATKFKIEDKVSGTGLIQTLQRMRVPVEAISRSDGKMSGDKITRAMSASPMIEQGRVFLPKNANFIDDFLLEVMYFPNGKHDDQVDPMCDAVIDNLIDYNPMEAWKKFHEEFY